MPRPAASSGPRLLLLLALTLAPAGACGGGGGSPPTDATAPAAAALDVEPGLLELPPVAFGRSTQGEFRLRNRLDEPLRILRVGPTGCDCNVVHIRLPDRPPGQDRPQADPDALDLVLAPGERMIVGMKLSTARYREPVSRKTGGIPVVLEGHAPAILQWAVDIWTPFWLEPWSVHLGPIGVRERATASVQLQAKDDARFTPVLPEEVDGWRIQVSKLPSPDFDRYRVDLMAPEELPLGPFQKRIEVRTDVPEGPVMAFYLTGEVVPDLTVHPSRLLFPALRPVHQDLTLLMRDPMRTAPRPRVRFEGEAASRLRLEFLASEDPRRLRLRVHAEGEAPERSLGARLILETGDPETPVLEVPCTLLPLRPDRP